MPNADNIHRPLALVNNPSKFNPSREFCDFLNNLGLQPSNIIEDGKKHRCPTADRPTRRDGEYLIFSSKNPYGYGKNYRTGEFAEFRRAGNLTPADSKEIEQKRQLVAADTAAAAAQAAATARKILSHQPQADNNNPYLLRKNVIAAPGIRLSNTNQLIIPLYNESNQLKSLQFIAEDGSKRFLTGGKKQCCFFIIKATTDSTDIFIAEGYATAATIHAATSATAIVAFDAGNLLPVATAIAKKFPNNNIIICADDDHSTFEKTGKNPGIDKATAAAKAISAAVAVPKFDVERTEKDTDFNDLARLQGFDAVKRCLHATKQTNQAITRHQSILDTATRVIEEDGLLKLIKYDNKTEMEISKVVASFKIEPFESIYIPNEGQYIKASFQNCKKRRDVVLTPDCWTSSQKFLKILPDAEFSFTGNIEVVQLVKRHVAQFDLEQKNGTRTAGFHHSEAGELQFITEHGALTASGSRTDLVYLNEVPSGCALQQHSPLLPEQTAPLDRLLAFNAGEVTLPILGWAAACFFKDRIHATHSCFPLLNLEGEAGAGKSSTAREALMRLWGITSAPRAIAEQTKFTMMRQVSSSNTIPLVYEENKSTKMNEKQVQMVSNLIRDTYNSFEGQRGFADQSMRTYRYDAPVCIIGETGFTESALLDRLVTVSFSRNTSQHYLQNFKQLKHLPLESLGRSLLDHSLATDQAAVAAGIESELAQVDPKLTDRPRLNAAILRFGLRTLLSLLGLSDQFDQEEFALIDQAVVQTTTDDDAPGRKSAVDRILEHMARMATRAVPQEGATKQLSDICLEHGVHYQIKDGFIRLWVSGAYPEFQRWAKQYGYSDDVLPEATFKKQIKSANYYVENKAAEIGAKVRKCYVLRLDSMTNAGIDVDFYH